MQNIELITIDNQIYNSLKLNIMKISKKWMQKFYSNSSDPCKDKQRELNIKKKLDSKFKKLK